jgi:adenine-specific DNA-methyltransferase
MTDTSKSLPESLDGASIDIAEANRARLRSLFPSVFTETRDEKGNLVESVDFEKLKAELGTFTDLFEARRERYGMDWPGKKDCLKTIQTPTFATLKPVQDESKFWGTTENLFIEGDNLEVLKLLQKSYYGKVKMIYIDPPYNTGNEFIYPDDFSESLDAYLTYAGLLGEGGRRIATNTPNEGRFHTKWLSMMYPRLYLARNLLREDGFISVSIDENELPALRYLLNDVFGEENFVGVIAWKKSSGNNDAELSYVHENVVVYRKSPDAELGKLPQSDAHLASYQNPDNDSRGPWTSSDYTSKWSKEERPKLWYPIINPTTKKDCFPPEGRTWAYSQDVSKQNVDDNRLWWGSNGTNERPRYKRFLTDTQGGMSPRSYWEDVGTNEEGFKRFRDLGFTKDDFPHPKPTGLIRRLITILGDKNGLVLDFFGGSGSTADAVHQINQEDGGHRNFIIVQLPEPCDNKPGTVPRYSTIAKVCAARIKSLFGTEANSGSDGFRYLRLDKSNFHQWQKLGADTPVENITEQLELHIEHVAPSASPEDLLFEILIKAGFRPTEKAELVEMAGLPVFSVSDGALLICLADRVSKELIDAVAEAEPMNFFCLDSAFAGDDQLKANAVQTFSARNQGRDKAAQIVFRTV